ncbi:hypothetical protein [Novosphingobium sp. PASSN1]|uniref:hypothetical protein n=1 Tax=Novosphingobium sp. PASSN1 TaxID=2015561 RepID=UPI000BD92F5B|nr:hypothetical protein [Novosphingobium sp. PASSN1]OYU33258.1 MAG: hypothetical protein CFE35_21015 [Novosphingobium sp. PASSN1]
MTRTNQEIFDTCLAHLRAQGRRSVHPDLGICAYRGADNLKCAIGILIPDDKYHPGLENNCPDHSAVQEAAGITVDQVKLAERIQGSMHDTLTDDLSDLEDAAQRVAHDFNLCYTT